MTERAANIYIPDYQAWENFYENTAKKNSGVGFGLETESEAVRQQHQQNVILDRERVKICEQSSQTEPKIIKVVSPTEQTVQQAANVMKKAGIKGKAKCSRKRNNNNKGTRGKKAKSNGKSSKKRKSSFSYRTLGDIFSKRK